MTNKYEEIKQKLNNLNGKIMTMEELDTKLINIGFYSEKESMSNSDIQTDIIENFTIAYTYNVGEEQNLSPFVIEFKVMEKDDDFNSTKIKILDNY